MKISVLSVANALSHARGMLTCLIIQEKEKTQRNAYYALTAFAVAQRMH